MKTKKMTCVADATTTRSDKGRSNADSQNKAAEKREKEVSAKSILSSKIKARLISQAEELFNECNMVDGSPVFSAENIEECRKATDGFKFWYTCTTMPADCDEQLRKVQVMENGALVTKTWCKRPNEIADALSIYRAVNSWCNYSADAIAERELSKQIQEIADAMGIPFEQAKVFVIKAQAMKKVK